MQKLNNLRREIDKTDKEIINALKKRFKIINKVKKYKKENHIRIVNIKREKEILSRIRNRSENKREKAYLTNIFNSVIKNSRKLQG